MLEFNVMLLGAKPWRMVDENTGEVREGVSCHYINLDSPIDSEKGKGFEAIKQTLPKDQYTKILNLSVPCIATMRASLEMSGNRTKIKPITFDLVEPVSIEIG